MKKIYYLLAFVAMAFTACQKQPIIPNTTPKHEAKLTLTLASADYKLLDTSIYANKSLSFHSDEDAKLYVPKILAAKYPLVDDKSTADVTYTITALVPPASPKPADSTFAKVAYTLTNGDYLLLPGNKFTDFSAAQILSWLPIHYTKPVANQLALVTFTYFENGVTSTVAQSFLYVNGAWKKIYTITPAQYTAIGKGGTFNDFSSSDDAQLTNYFNTLLKADLAVSSTVKTGDVQYVSYKYFGGGTFQRVIALMFDGTNWTTQTLPSTTSTLSFARDKGVWAANSTVNYTLVKDDYTYIGTQTTAGTAAGRASVAKYPDFNTSADTDTDFWSPDNVNAALIAVLTNKFKSTAIPNQSFIVTYADYKFGKTTNVAKTFVYDGTAFVVPK